MISEYEVRARTEQERLRDERQQFSDEILNEKHYNWKKK